MKQMAFDAITRGQKTKQFWLTPPDLYKKFDEEFHITYDPCPFPRNNFDGLRSDWGTCSWVNPPYSKIDGIGYAKWEWKTIEEVKKGKTVILLKPVNSSEHELFNLNPEIRCLGRIKWLATDGSGESKSYKKFIALIFNGDI